MILKYLNCINPGTVLESACHEDSKTPGLLDFMKIGLFKVQDNTVFSALLLNKKKLHFETMNLGVFNPQ